MRGIVIDEERKAKGTLKTRERCEQETLLDGKTALCNIKLSYNWRSVCVRVRVCYIDVCLCFFDVCVSLFDLDALLKMDRVS